MTPTPSQDPPIPQGGGGLMLWPWPWQGGWGGTRNLEHIYIYVSHIYVSYIWLPKWSCLKRPTHPAHLNDSPFPWNSNPPTSLDLTERWRGSLRSGLPRRWPWSQFPGVVGNNTVDGSEIPSQTKHLGCIKKPINNGLSTTYISTGDRPISEASTVCQVFLWGVWKYSMNSY